MQDNQHPTDGIQGNMPEGKEGEVPEEIRQWIEAQDRDYPGSGHAIGWKKGAIAMYHKMQEEIKDAHDCVDHMYEVTKAYEQQLQALQKQLEEARQIS